MSQGRSRELVVDVADVRRRIERWRRTRVTRGRMPGDLWRGAADLARTHGVSRVALALRLDYYSLKKHVSGTKEPASFVEVVLGKGPSQAAESIVEFARPNGSRLTIRSTGDVDLIKDLARVFLEAP